MNKELLEESTLDVKVSQYESDILDRFAFIFDMSDDLLVRKLINKYFNNSNKKALIDIQNNLEKGKSVQKISIRMSLSQKNKLDDRAETLNLLFNPKVKYNKSIIIKSLIQELGNEEVTVKRTVIPKEVAEQMEVLSFLQAKQNELIIQNV